MLVRRTVDALLLRRDAFMWMVFNQRSNGDAVIVVAIVYGLWVLIFWQAASRIGLLSGAGTFVNLLIRTVVSGGFAWVIASGAMWLAGQYVLEGSGRFGVVLPVVGFSHAPLALVPVLAWIGLSGFSLLVPALWSGAMLTVGAQVSLELPREKAIIAAVAAIVGWYIGFVVF